MMKIAFYAPLKSPNHPIPSGDRLMARLLLGALEAGAAEVRLASELRTYSRAPDQTRLEDLRAEAASEADRLIAAWTHENWRPDIWFSYHPYYKSPDWIGPRIADVFGAALVTAEASFSSTRAAGAWAAWHGANLATLQSARCHFYMTARDRAGLEAMPGRTGALVHLPPFIDAGKFQAASRPVNRPPNSPPSKLAVVAMMRADVKRDSYQALARSLELILDLDWTLDIVGDGEARGDVEQAFEPIPTTRLRWHGRLDQENLITVLQSADVFVWPGLEEAYGLAYLEAQAMGLPVVAFDNAGVPEVVIDGRTGLLAGCGDTQAFADCTRRLLTAPGLAHELGCNARDFVQCERTLARARTIIGRTLADVGDDNS